MPKLITLPFLVIMLGITLISIIEPKIFIIFLGGIICIYITFYAPELPVAIYFGGLLYSILFSNWLDMEISRTTLIAMLGWIWVALLYMLIKDQCWTYQYGGYLWFALAGLTFSVVASLLYTIRVDSALLKFTRYIYLVLLPFFLGYVIGIRPKRLKRFYILTAILGITTILYTIAFIPDILQNIRLTLNDNMNPIWLGRGLGLLAILLVWGICRLQLLVKYICAVLLIPVLVLIVLTGSRGPIVALSGAIICGSFQMLSLKKLLHIGMIGGIIIYGLFLLNEYIPVEISDRVSNFSLEGTALDRIQLWQTALNSFLANPVLGTGFAGFSAVSNYEFPHNLTLEIACELGLVGLTAFVFFVGVSLKKCFSDNSRTQFLMPLTAMILIFALINSQLSGDIGSNYILWLASGIIDGLSKTNAETLSPRIPA